MEYLKHQIAENSIVNAGSWKRSTNGHFCGRHCPPPWPGAMKQSRPDTQETQNLQQHARRSRCCKYTALTFPIACLLFLDAGRTNITSHSAASIFITFSQDCIDAVAAASSGGFFRLRVARVVLTLGMHVNAAQLAIFMACFAGHAVI